MMLNIMPGAEPLVKVRRAAGTGHGPVALTKDEAVWPAGATSNNCPPFNPSAN